MLPSSGEPAGTDTQPARFRGRQALTLAAGTFLFCALTVSSMRLKSATYDEPLYLTAGYTHLKLHDYRVNPQTPPLAKLLAAAPLLVLDVNFRPDDVAWREGYQNKLARQFLYRWNDADHLLFWARLPIVALGCLLAAAVHLWTLRLAGPGPAAIALFLCVLNPDVIAHAQLATTDVAIALFIFMTVVAFQRLSDGLTMGRVLVAGIGLGAALATKASAAALFPILGALSLVVALVPRPLVLSAFGRQRTLGSRRSRLLALGAAVLAMTVIGWAAVWAVHGFRASASPDPQVAPYDWSLLPAGHPAGDALRHARDWRLLPEPYLYGLAFRVAANSPTEEEGVAGAFLLGRVSETGWWYYFPVTFALKTPLPLIAMAAGALIRTVRRGPRRVDAFIWLPVVIYAGLMMAQRLNIGHRYLLPIYPFLFVAAGGFGAWAIGVGAARWRRWLLGGLLAWYGLGTLLIHPHYLAYFNEAAGGPRRGYRRLVDSNLDWGQDLKGLKAYLDAHGIASVKLSYFGMADPEYHGIRAERLPGFPPPVHMATEVLPGELVAVSATNLQSVRLEHGRRLMRRLRELEPVGHIGYSILLYRPPFRWTLEQER